MNRLDVKNLSFSYDESAVLSDVSFSVKKGEFVALLGVNGVGKSTLLKLLLGELKPSHGSISWSVPYTSFSYISQEVLGVGFPATVMEVVLSNLITTKKVFGFYSKEDKNKALKVLKEVGMEDQEHKTLSELSGGQRQRVMMARALISDPEVLILDEPTSGIDRGATLELLELLRSLCDQKDVSVLLVTHDLNVIHDYAHVILKLEEGKVVSHG